MPFILSEKSNGTALYLWEMSEKVEDFRNVISSDLFENIVETNKLDKRKIEKFSQVMLLAEAGLDYKQISYLENGKPLAYDGSFISFSHSGELSTLLVDQKSCGIDLEYPSEKVKRISSKFINENELDLIKREENINWTWSIKESIYKYFGERVLFKEHIQVVDIQEEFNKAVAYYDGFHGKGIFELKLLRVKKYYLAYTKSYTPE